jgi:hypothetical protein
MRVSLESAVLQPTVDGPVELITEVLVVSFMHRAPTGDALADVLRDPSVITPRQHQRGAGIEYLGQADVAGILRDSVKGVEQLGTAGGLLQPSYNSVVAIAVVDDGVALGPVDQGFHMRYRRPRDAEQRVNVTMID